MLSIDLAQFVVLGQDVMCVLFQALDYKVFPIAMA